MKAPTVGMMIGRRRFALGLGAVTIVTAAPYALAAGATSWPPWPHNRRAALSLTYDDGLDSQIDTVAPALDRYGLRATFFLTQQNMEARSSDWLALAGKGHEIGDHTAHHPCNLKGYSSERLESDEILPSQRFLAGLFGPDARRTFAYPCGAIELGSGDQLEGELRYISLLRRHYMAARAADGDPNDPRRVGQERYQLQAIAPTYERDDPQLAIAYVRKALAWRRWAILIFHDVVPTRRGDGDTSIASHEAILRWISGQSLWCAPMGEVFTYLQNLRAKS